MNQINYTNFDYTRKYKSSDVGFKAKPEEQSLPPDYTRLPYIYQPEPKKGQSFMDVLKKIDVMQLVCPWIETPLAMIAACTGFGFCIDKIGKSFEKEYEKSSIGKAAKLGDKIAQSNFVQSKPMQGIFKAFKTGGKKVGGVFKNSDLVNAAKKTPSMPEWGIVKQEMFNQEYRIIEDFNMILGRYGFGSTNRNGLTGAVKTELIDGPMIEVKRLGIDNAEKQMLKDVFKKDISKLKQEEIVTQVLMKRLRPDIAQAEIDSIIAKGKPEAQKILKQEMLKTLGLTAEQVTQIQSDTTGKYAKLVKDACEKAKGKIKIAESHIDGLGKIQPFERQLSCEGVYNKLHSISEGGKTKLGQLFSKFIQKAHRGFTFGGGKIGALLFVSPMIVEAFRNTKHAEPNEKIGTLTHDLLTFGTWVFTFPLALKVVHKFGGMQYAGMSEETVKNYRNEINLFNEKVETKGFKSWKEYRTAKKELKTKLKGFKKVKGPQNLLTRIGKGLGSFVTMDLELIKGYKSGNFFADTLRKLPNFGKNFAGVPLRLVLWGVLCMGVFESLISKGISLVFGKRHDGMKREEHEKQKETQKEFAIDDLNEKLYHAYEKKLNPQVENNLPVNKQRQAFSEKQFDMTSRFDEKFTKQNIQNGQSSMVPPVVPSRVSTVEPQIQPQVQQPVQPVAQKPQEKVEQTIVPNQVNKVVTENKTKDIQPVIQQEKVDNYTYIPAQNSTIKKENKAKTDIYTYIPSSENVIKKQEENVNKYIPSQRVGNLEKTYDNSGLKSALDKANAAEENAVRILAGKFPN